MQSAWLEQKREACPSQNERGMADHLRSVVLDAYLRDTDRAYTLIGERYQRADLGGSEPFSAQEFLLQWYRTHPSTAEEP
jgi:hypothetical protein